MSTIAVGTILVLSMGEYSDYQWAGPFRVLKEMDQRELLRVYEAEWKAEQPEDDWWEHPEGKGFIAWLAKNGWVEDLGGVFEWWLGTYANLGTGMLGNDTSRRLRMEDLG